MRGLDKVGRGGPASYVYRQETRERERERGREKILDTSLSWKLGSKFVARLRPREEVNFGFRQFSKLSD